MPLGLTAASRVWHHVIPVLVSPTYNPVQLGLRTHFPPQHLKRPQIYVKKLAFSQPRRNKECHVTPYCAAGFPHGSGDVQLKIRSPLGLRNTKKLSASKLMI